MANKSDTVTALSMLNDLIQRFESPTTTNDDNGLQSEDQSRLNIHWNNNCGVKYTLDYAGCEFVCPFCDTKRPFFSDGVVIRNPKRKFNG